MFKSSIKKDEFNYDEKPELALHIEKVFEEKKKIIDPQDVFQKMPKKYKNKKTQYKRSEELTKMKEKKNPFKF